MPALTQALHESPDGIRRYSTSVRVIVHSHNLSQPLDISDDVENVSISKVIKSAGNAQVSLTARLNYLNLIDPNDYINIYFDIGDGEGWTRTFFGFVDRIEEQYQVSGEGQIFSRYVLSCTDFFKAFQKTQIYFNPHMANRTDFAGQFIGANNIGGLALQMRGILMAGTPADMVLNIIFMMFGFGSQFIMPASYADNARLEISRLRSERQAYILNRLPREVRDRISAAGGIDALRNEAVANAAEVVARDIAEGRLPDDLSPVQRQHQIDLRSRNILQQTFNDDFQLVSQVAQIHSSTQNTTLPTLLDVIDPLTFVETKAMDGYIASTGVWQQQGSLMNLIMSVCHEPVNELFFDLRPVGQNERDLDEGSYSREPDDIGGNVASKPGSRNGVKYVPALVMREYPFSTVDNVDGSNVSVLGGSLGVLPFGAIFSNEPNRPGRHIVKIPSINVEDRAANLTSVQAKKHLDVAVIHEEEITNTNFGRSDNDHFNLTEFVSDAINGSDARFFLSDVIPIATPVHIARHGLRVRSISTRYARFSLSAVASQVAAREEVSTEEPEPAPETFILPEHPDENDIPSGRNWRALLNLANAYGVGLNVYLIARTMHSEYPFSSSTDPEHPGVLVPGWAAINIAKHGYRAGGGRVPFGRDEAGERVFHTTNVGRGILGSAGALGAFGSSRPQSTARFPGDKGSAEQTQALAARNAFRLELTDDQRALVEKYFDIARRMLAGDPTVADPSPQGGTVTFEHQTPPGRPSSSEIERRKSRGQEMYELSSAPWFSTPRATFGFAATAIDSTPAETSEVARTDNEVRPPSTDGGVDTSITRAQVIRWALLHDHWYQHNLEYLNGTIRMRPAPEIRVGYRLDIVERNLSMYVEGVSHTWSYPNTLTTQLQVTRGQPNNPAPLYVLPPSSAFGAPSTQRQLASRLSRYFIVPDLHSVRRALAIRGGQVSIRPESIPSIDTAQDIPTYGERVIQAGQGDVPMETSLDDQERDAARDGEVLGLLDLESVGTESTSTIDGISLPPRATRGEFV